MSTANLNGHAVLALSWHIPASGIPWADVELGAGADLEVGASVTLEVAGL